MSMSRLAAVCSEKDSQIAVTQKIKELHPSLSPLCLAEGESLASPEHKSLSSGLWMASSKTHLPPPA